VFLWFAGVSVVFVWFVFRSPALDYRLVMLGSVLPVGDVVLGGPRLLHTLFFSVALLTVVMLATQKRRLVRRRWIGLPIGVLMHLVLDGIWTQTAVFWWPFFGFTFDSTVLPELDHGPGISLVLEAIGVVALGWAWVNFGLTDPANRRTFLHTGHLPREPTA
jgi:hypothetical protein